MFLPLHDRNPLKVIPFQIVTLALILLCTVVFLYQQILPGDQQQALALSFGMLPAVLFEHRELAPELMVLPAEMTLLSSMFLHSGWMHLISNMAFLWVFGDNVEDSMGHWRFFIVLLRLRNVRQLQPRPGRERFDKPIDRRQRRSSGGARCIFDVTPES